MREEMLHYAPNDKAINEERQGMRGLALSWDWYKVVYGELESQDGTNYASAIFGYIASEFEG